MHEVFDVNTYCQELSKSERLSARVIGWTGRWSLFGSFVLCCQCLNAQSVDDAGRAFTHLPGCTAGQTGSNPWRELRQVLIDVLLPDSHASERLGEPRFL
ncbi:hypothetical protein [Pseudomonas congelans]|uniref:hypothetical protein n=1 Tax=Pseudomonas congelans TaxID=200452 RepID=UPI00117A520D|nr:hypothetical protein [Pseudomonas congelans]